MRAVVETVGPTTGTKPLVDTPSDDRPGGVADIQTVVVRPCGHKRLGSLLSFLAFYKITGTALSVELTV